LLAAMARLPDDAVLAALRLGVELQIIVAGEHGFRFRHALTQEAVLVGLLPSELVVLVGNALAAFRAAYQDLPGSWCTLAADLAERAGDRDQAAALLLEAGRRDLALGALASAEAALTRARELAGRAAPDTTIEVDEALTEVFALSGQVDRAIET